MSIDEKTMLDGAEGLFKRYPGYTENFNTLVSAFENGDVALLACVDKASGKDVAVICAVNKAPDGKFEFAPLAKLFDGNPYGELIPPA